MGKMTESYENNKTQGNTVQVYCGSCSRETRHLVMHSLDHSVSEELGGGHYTIDWASHYQIIQCQGCMTVSFREVNYFSEDAGQIGPDEWDDGSTVLLFPQRSKSTLVIKEFRNIPYNLRRIYRETIECFNIDANTLSAAGLRALVEGLCAELNVVDGPKEITKKDGSTQIKRFKNLEGKISGLHEKGYLTKHHSDVLHEHRYLGNEAVHELSQPCPQ